MHVRCEPSFLISIGEPSCSAQSAKNFKRPYNKSSLLRQASELRRKREASRLGLRYTLPSVDMCLSSANYAPAQLRREDGCCVRLQMLEIAVLGPR
jgi:hypothetical protein